jgi:hypothetical protein
MNAHLTSTLTQICFEDPDRGPAAARQRPQPRRRRHIMRPRDSLDDVAHTFRRRRARAPATGAPASHGATRSRARPS